MLNVSPIELLVILAVGLIVLGPERLPQAARQVGRVTAELRRMASGFNAEMRDALAELDRDDASPQAPAPAAPLRRVPEPVVVDALALPGPAPTEADEWDAWDDLDPALHDPDPSP